MTKEYKTVDRIFALLTLFVGYFFIRWFLLGGEGFGVTAVCVALLILETVYFILTAKKSIDFRSILAFVVVLIFSIGFCMTASPLALFLNNAIFAVGSIYVFFRAHGNGIEKKQGDYFFFDIIKALFVVPFRNLGAFFCAIFKKREGKEAKPSTKYALLGIAVAIFPVIIVTVLLTSDTAFYAVIKNIFRFDFETIFVNISYINLSIPFAIYFFGSLWGNSNCAYPEILTAEKADETAQKVKIIPLATTYAAIIPLLFVYALFFASQCIYFVSAFSEMLPEGFTYAEYARQGFFELCAVCIINFVVICVITAFTKRKDGKEAVFQRVLKVLLCIFTEALVVIDIAKMLLYINEYGLTQKRVVTSWFMVLLGILFLLLLLKQIFPKFKITMPAAAVTIILSAVLIFGNVDANIARYNVWAYQNGKLESVDIDMMYQLDDSAIEYVIPLLNDVKHDVRYEARSFLNLRADEILLKDLNEYTIHTLNAKMFLKQSYIIE